MQSPFPTIVMATLYLLFVRVAPGYMKDREPYQMKAFLFVFNTAIVLLNAYLTKEVHLPFKNLFFSPRTPLLSTYIPPSPFSPLHPKNRTVLFLKYRLLSYAVRNMKEIINYVSVISIHVVVLLLCLEKGFKAFKYHRLAV